MADYKIAVAIALQNGVSPVLAVIAKDLLKLEGGVDKLTKSFAGWNKALLGVAGILGGTAIIGGLYKFAEHGSKILDQQDKMQRSGMELNQVLALQADYYNRIAKTVPTSTASEYLKTVNELRAVTGTTASAAALAPKALMVDTLLSNTFGHQVTGEYYKLLRSEEMKGISTNDAKREAFTDSAFSYITAFGGKLQARDYQTLARRGGAAFINMKPGAMGPMSVLTADLGGDAAGTAMMTFHQLMTGANTMSKQQGQMWQDLGLLDMSKVTKTGFGGSRLQLGLGALAGAQQYSGDQPGWVKNVLWPAIEKASGGDPAKRELIISKLAPNRNANKMIHMFGEAGFQDQIMKDLGLAGQVESIPDAYKHFTSRNPLGVRQAFGDQYESMLQAMGAPLMQAAMPVMQQVTAMFSSIGQYANSNPETIKHIAEGIGLLGIAMTGAGMVALLSAIGPAGWLIGGLGALAVALTDDRFRQWLKGTSISDAVSSWVTKWLAADNDILKAINGIFDAIFNTIADKIKSIGSLFSHAPKKGDEDFVRGLKEGYMPMRFEPGQRALVAAQPIALSLNVDGKTLAQAVSDQLMYLYEHSTRGYSPDGQGAYGGARGSFGT